MADRVTFKCGSASDYSSVTKDPNTFYYTIDNNKFYMGSNFLASGGDIPYTTELPTSDNTSGHLIAVVTDAIPVTRYDGYMYIIVVNPYDISTYTAGYYSSFANRFYSYEIGPSLPLTFNIAAITISGAVNPGCQINFSSNTVIYAGAYFKLVVTVTEGLVFSNPTFTLGQGGYVANIPTTYTIQSVSSGSSTTYTVLGTTNSNSNGIDYATFLLAGGDFHSNCTITVSEVVLSDNPIV